MGDRTKSNTSFLEGPVRRPPIARADRKMLPHPTSLGSTTLRLMLNMPSRTWAMTHTSQVFFPQVTMMLSPHSVPRHVPRCRYHPRTPSFLPLQGHFLPPLTCTVRIHCPTARRYLHSVLISAHLPPCPPAFFFTCAYPVDYLWRPFGPGNAAIATVSLTITVPCKWGGQKSGVCTTRTSPNRPSGTVRWAAHPSKKSNVIYLSQLRRKEKKR